MKIWLDAGHGGTDTGASAKGILEKNLNLDIDNRLTQLIKTHGIDVERTRTTDVTVVPNVRARRIRNSGAKYCISTHINAGGGKGAETIHSIHNDGVFAGLILDELVDTGLKRRRVFSKENSKGRDYYYMHRLTGSVTTIIVENGFIDNEEDRQFILKPENRQKCAEAVMKALSIMEDIEYKGGTDTDMTYYKQGDKGKEVKELQEKLIELNFEDYMNPYGADGSYGPATKDTVLAFQEEYNLQVDGIAGPETLGKIDELINKEDRRYKVQLGAFSQRENAEKLLKELKGKGYEAFIKIE